MLIELFCPDCACRFTADAATPGEEISDRMAREGPWIPLADGATFEDMVSITLLARGEVRCPDCWSALLVRDASARHYHIECDDVTAQTAGGRWPDGADWFDGQR
jgi:hypothetical protein